MSRLYPPAIMLAARQGADSGSTSAVPGPAESTDGGTPRRSPPPPLQPQSDTSGLIDIDNLRPIPLREVVHRCLDDWGVESTDSEDDDDFCGWRVGSRAILVADQVRPIRPRRAVKKDRPSRPSIMGALGGLLVRDSSTMPRPDEKNKSCTLS